MTTYDTPTPTVDDPYAEMTVRLEAAQAWRLVETASTHLHAAVAATTDVIDDIRLREAIDEVETAAGLLRHLLGETTSTASRG